MIDGSHLAEWVSRIVRFPTVSPAHCGPRAGVAGEARLAREVAEWFREFGGEVHSHEVLPGRPNVYGIWTGPSHRWAGVDVHMDTVGVEEMAGDPFSGEIRGGCVHGRGAVDTKATLGVALALLEAMHQTGARPAANLLIAATVDEEDGARGAPAFAAWLRGRQLVLDQLAVAEPTLCGPVIAHKGVLRLEFQVEGQPAHSSQPQLGRNAITAAARLTLALEEEHRRLLSIPPATALGPPTLAVTLIHGGSGMNVVPASCSLAMDRRLTAGEKAEAVEAALLDLARSACPLPFTAHTVKRIEAFSQPADSPWIRQLAQWSGKEPVTAPYCTNAWAYGEVARERVVMGPGSIDQAHGVEEWVAISELEKLADIYTRWWGVTV